MSTWRDFAGAHDPAADALSARMRRAWTSFAATGTPTDDETGPWPTDALVQLGARPTIGDDAVSERVGVWLGGR